MIDLFGHYVLDSTLPARREKLKRNETPKGYAGIPGTGPKGETCGTCEHAKRVHYHDKAYWKCALLQRVWTRSYGTDIRLKTPSCRHWELAKLSPFST